MKIFLSTFDFSSFFKTISFSNHKSEVAYLIERARSSMMKKISEKLTVKRKIHIYLKKNWENEKFYHLKFHFYWKFPFPGTIEQISYTPSRWFPIQIWIQHFYWPENFRTLEETFQASYTHRWQVVTKGCIVFEYL